MAFTKEQKQKLLAQYQDWLRKSHAVFVLQFDHMTMKDVEDLRTKARELGAEFHVTKNTLLKLAMEQADYKRVKRLDGTSLCAFAFEDVPAIAKLIADTIKEKKEEIFSVKLGYLDRQPISAQQVKALAELPPLPVMRARLLGTLLAPATKLVRTLVEPARQVAAVIKAYSEREGAAA